MNWPEPPAVPDAVRMRGTEGAYTRQHRGRGPERSRHYPNICDKTEHCYDAKYTFKRGRVTFGIRTTAATGSLYDY